LVDGVASNATRSELVCAGNAWFHHPSPAVTVVDGVADDSPAAGSASAPQPSPAAPIAAHTIHAPTPATRFSTRSVVVIISFVQLRARSGASAASSPTLRAAGENIAHRHNGVVGAPDGPEPTGHRTHADAVG